MCGIYGAVALEGVLRHRDAARAMAAAVHHRGPDGSGCLERPEAVIGVERLRIVDLDPRADQPFADPTGQRWLACNGEIYNAPELRRRFARYPYRSRSDVEPLLPLLAERGAAGVADANGMYALAQWDAETRTLLLARDRAGEKPLFWMAVRGEIWFASEVPALLKHPACSRALDREALAEYLQLGCVREPRTLFATIRKVPAGSVVTLDRRGTHIVRYWDVETMTPEARGRDNDQIARLRGLLTEAVARQVVSDRPVGVFTSGGLDSSLIAALAVHALGADRVRTFAVGFPQADYDERPAAARLARSLGTTHAEVLADDPALGAAYEAMGETGEPIADPAALPTYLLARETKRHVAVVLSGEGGDELFAGYPTYVGHRLAGGYAKLPEPLRRTARRALSLIPSSAGKVTLEFLLKRFVADAERPWLERHVAWAGSMLPAEVVQPSWPSAHPDVERDWADPVEGAMRFDYQTGLRERLLVKLDRATMRVALEARAPFLDPAVTRAAFTLPGRTHLRGWRTKRVLRAMARGSVPSFILRRRKRGLSVPIAAWLNDGFRTEADRLLDPARLGRRPYLNVAAVTRLLEEHRARRADHARALWTLIVLEQWIERWNPEVT